MSELNQLKFEGTIQRIYETKQGTTKNGDQWKAVEFLVTETKERPQSAVFKLFASGDKVDKIDKFLKYQKVGDDVTVSFNLKTSEYNGKTYNGVEAWSVFGKKQSEETHKKIKSVAVASKRMDAEFAQIVDDDLPF